MTSSCEAIPMTYFVSEIDQKSKKDEKVVNKGLKNKNRKRNKGNLIVKDDDDAKNVYVLIVRFICF